MAEKKDIDVVLNELVRRMNEHGRRLRALESRNVVIETRLNSTEDSVLRASDEGRNRNKKIDSSLVESDGKILKIENDISKINKNMEKMAKKTDLRELENMVGLFNPLTSKFITKEDVLRILEER